MDEYAPQYSDEEKLKIIVLHALWVIPAVLVSWLYIESPLLWLHTNPWISCHPHVYKVLVYGISLGLPLFGFLTSIYLIPEQLKIINLKQYPLHAQKTFRKTKYAYGIKATLRSYLQLVISLMGIVIFGSYVVSNMIAKDSSIIEENSEVTCLTSYFLK